MNITKTSTLFVAVALALTMVACSQNKTTEATSSVDNPDAPAEEAVAEAIAPAEEAVAEAVAPAEEAVAEAIAPAEEAVAEAIAPAEEAVAEAIAPAEEAVATTTTIPDSAIIVKVNGKEMTYGKIIADFKDMLKMSGAPADKIDEIANLYFSQNPAVIIKDVITQSLLFDECTKSGIVVTEADIDKEIEKIKESIPENRSFEDILSYKNITLDEFKSNLKKQLPVMRMLDEIQKKDVEVTDEEVLEEYNKDKDSYTRTSPEQVEASHILIQVAKDATPEAKAEAKAKCEALLEQIKVGADFATLAKENSDCPSKDKGGNLGFFAHGQMVPEFDAAAFSLEKGAISDVVETEFGYHIIKVTDKKESVTITPNFDDIKDKIKAYLTTLKESDNVRKFLSNLEKNATIEYTDDYKQLVPSQEQENELDKE